MFIFVKLTDTFYEPSRWAARSNLIQNMGNRIFYVSDIVEGGSVRSSSVMDHSNQLS